MCDASRDQLRQKKTSEYQRAMHKKSQSTWRVVHSNWYVAALGFCLLAAQPVAADCLSSTDGLLGWWPGDGNANNIFGTNTSSRSLQVAQQLKTSAMTSLYWRMEHQLAGVTISQVNSIFLLNSPAS